MRDKRLSITLINKATYIVVENVIGVVVMSGAVAGGGYGSGFALIVVLFILLIIVGASYVGYGY